jgi:hypothetical protein
MGKVLRQAGDQRRRRIARRRALTMARSKRSTKRDEVRPAAIEAQIAEDNARMQAFVDREARGEDPITGEPATRRPTVPWVSGNREDWILELIADYERHLQTTGNCYFILAAYDASIYLPDRAAHDLAWVDAGLALIVKRLLAGDNLFGIGRGERPLHERARKILRDGELGLRVMNRLPFERGNETLAVAHVAGAEKLSITVVGNAWRDLKKRRRGQQH